jgi:uncharacterized membrane protein YecN with MAPEG domain
MMVTPLYAGLLVLLFVVLSIRVIASRLRGRVAFGDGGNPALLRRIRGHANFVEYVPLALVLMAVLEMSRFSIYVLHAVGILLLVGRLLHGYAFSFAAHSRFGRRVGAALTLLVLLIEAVLCLYQAFVAHSLWLRI